MSSTHRLRRPARLCAITCALLVPAMTGAAFAAPDPDAQSRRAQEQLSYAQERYYMSQPAEGPAAQERYYSSYGAPKPSQAPQSPAPSDDTPWLPIALSLTGVLAIAGVSATQLRRVRIRRRRAVHTAA